MREAVHVKSLQSAFGYSEDCSMFANVLDQLSLPGCTELASPSDSAPGLNTGSFNQVIALIDRSSTALLIGLRS